MPKTKTKTTPQFNAGDKVRVRSGLSETKK